MVKIGLDVSHFENKGPAYQISQMVQNAKNWIPCGDELASVICDEVMSFEEWCEYT